MTNRQQQRGRENFGKTLSLSRWLRSESAQKRARLVRLMFTLRSLYRSPRVRFAFAH